MNRIEIDARDAATAPFHPDAPHELLAAMAGDWSGPVRTWLDPPAAPEESVQETSARLVLGGRWLRLEYASHVMGKAHAGEMLIGFHRDAQAFELAWIDSFHTGTAILLFVGAIRDDGIISVLGSYDAGGERWGWRTTFRLESPDSLIVEAWNISPAGEEERAIETRLSRRIG